MQCMTAAMVVQYNWRRQATQECEEFWASQNTKYTLPITKYTNPKTKYSVYTNPNPKNTLPKYMKHTPKYQIYSPQYLQSLPSQIWRKNIKNKTYHLRVILEREDSSPPWNIDPVRRGIMHALRHLEAQLCSAPTFV